MQMVLYSVEGREKSSSSYETAGSTLALLG